jgi:hypothetical protein
MVPDYLTSLAISALPYQLLLLVLIMRLHVCMVEHSIMRLPSYEIVEIKLSAIQRISSEDSKKKQKDKKSKSGLVFNDSGPMAKHIQLMDRSKGDKRFVYELEVTIPLSIFPQMVAANALTTPLTLYLNIQHISAAVSETSFHLHPSLPMTGIYNLISLKDNWLPLILSPSTSFSTSSRSPLPLAFAWTLNYHSLTPAQPTMLSTNSGSSSNSNNELPIEGYPLSPMSTSSTSPDLPATPQPSTPFEPTNDDICETKVEGYHAPPPIIEVLGPNLLRIDGILHHAVMIPGSPLPDHAFIAHDTTATRTESDSLEFNAATSIHTLQISNGSVPPSNPNNSSTFTTFVSTTSSNSFSGDSKSGRDHSMTMSGFPQINSPFPLSPSPFPDYNQLVSVQGNYYGASLSSSSSSSPSSSVVIMSSDNEHPREDEQADAELLSPSSSISTSSSSSSLIDTTTTALAALQVSSLPSLQSLPSLPTSLEPSLFQQGILMMAQVVPDVAPPLQGRKRLARDIDEKSATTPNKLKAATPSNCSNERPVSTYARLLQLIVDEDVYRQLRQRGLLSAAGESTRTLEVLILAIGLYDLAVRYERDLFAVFEHFFDNPDHYDLPEGLDRPTLSRKSILVVHIVSKEIMSIDY